MCAWIIPPKPGLIEPAMAPEFYVDDGCAAVEYLGNALRFHMAVEQMPLECADGRPQHVVIVKIVRPLAGLATTISRLAICMGGEVAPGIQPRGAPGPFTPHLVR